MKRLHCTINGIPKRKGFCLLFVIFVFASIGTAQGRKVIILVRHAEKDISETADKNDPDLTTEGKERAGRLVQVIKKYKPGAVYSTDFKRTRDTGEPMAARRKLKIQIYDARKPADIIDSIMKSKTKRFLIIGHSNSIPNLANILGKKELFKNLDESEYGAIWIIRIKNGHVRKVEILPY